MQKSKKFFKINKSNFKKSNFLTNLASLPAGNRKSNAFHIISSSFFYYVIKVFFSSTN